MGHDPVEQWPSKHAPASQDKILRAVASIMEVQLKTLAILKEIEIDRPDGGGMPQLRMIASLMDRIGDITKALQGGI